MTVALRSSFSQKAINEKHPEEETFLRHIYQNKVLICVYNQYELLYISGLIILV